MVLYRVCLVRWLVKYSDMELDSVISAWEASDQKSEEYLLRDKIQSVCSS